MVASPKPAEIVEIGAIRSLVDSGQLVIACGGGGIPVTRQGNHLKGASAVIDKDFASELLAENLNADFLIILTAVEKVAVNFGKPEEKWLDDLDTEEARQFIKRGTFCPPDPCFPKFRLLLNLLNQNQDALPSLRCWKSKKTVSGKNRYSYPFSVKEAIKNEYRQYSETARIPV